MPKWHGERRRQPIGRFLTSALTPSPRSFNKQTCARCPAADFSRYGYVDALPLVANAVVEVDNVTEPTGSGDRSHP